MGISASSYPTNNYYPASLSTLGFVNYANGSGGDYSLGVNSPYLGLGSDGLNPGADFKAIGAATSGVGP